MRVTGESFATEKQMQAFILWVMTFITMHAPPGRPQFIPEAQESKEEAVTRYESIAADIYEVLQTEKPLFRGQSGKARTATVILSLMLHESGFRKDVDTGVGTQARGDNGRSWCLLQQNVGTGRTLAWNIKEDRPAKPICKGGQVSTRAVPCDLEADVHPGFTGPELVGDRKNCIRAGLRAMRMSFAACGRMSNKDWLRSYASGSCEGGSEASARRMNLAMTWFANHRPETDTLLFPTVQVASSEPIPVSMR